ncbi:MAG: STAS domain-containing protein [Phycisphaeraceae bacterium]|nr:STAS domain-containing protein [Phycisphaeraceae bacterium]
MASDQNASGDLTVRVESRNGAAVIVPSGEIDLNSSPVLRQEIKKVQASKPPRVIIDLAAVPYMDSAGVATLVEAMQFARKTSTRLVLCSLQDKVRSIFEISRLDTVFTIVDNEQAAFAS